MTKKDYLWIGLWTALMLTSAISSAYLEVERNNELENRLKSLERKVTTQSLKTEN